jgi:hypothetical protein
MDGFLDDRSNDREDTTVANKLAKDTGEQMPSPLPPEVIDTSERPQAQEEPTFMHVLEERPLHLRVLAALIQGQPDEARVEQALTLAQEVYEMELSNASFETYRSAS